MTIKQHGGVFGRNPSFNDVSVETLSIAGTALSSTAAELNILDGVTADATELNYLDGTSTSAVVASKAVLADASGNIAFPDGNGIDFSATAGTGTSELFDDYEEGTWTATVGCTGNATTTTTVTGYYTKIGRQVTVGFRSLNNIDTTGLSGFITISLPFACMAGSTAAFLGKTAWSGLTYPANITQVDALVSNTSSNMVFQLAGPTGTGGLLGVTTVTSGTSDIQSLTLTYLAS